MIHGLCMLTSETDPKMMPVATAATLYQVWSAKVSYTLERAPSRVAYHIRCLDSIAVT